MGFGNVPDSRQTDLDTGLVFKLPGNFVCVLTLFRFLDYSLLVF